MCKLAFSLHNRMLVKLFPQPPETASRVEIIEMLQLIFGHEEFTNVRFHVPTVRFFIAHEGSHKLLITVHGHLVDCVRGTRHGLLEILAS